MSKQRTAEAAYRADLPPFDEQIRRLAGFDRPVILVEGTRNVPDSDRPRLVAMGQNLAETLPRAIFRTGGASGSDEAFAEGVRAVDPRRVEYVLPQAGHRRKNRDAASPVFALEQLPDTGLRAVAEHTAAASPKYESLAQRYVRDTRTGALAAKTRYLLRDTLKVTGDPARGLPRADLGVFYIDETAPPLSGGTGHTIRVCLQQGVPAGRCRISRTHTALSWFAQRGSLELACAPWLSSTGTVDSCQRNDPGQQAAAPYVAHARSVRRDVRMERNA